MSRLEQRLRRLEAATGGDDGPPDFTLIFVSADGASHRTCRYVDGALVEVNDDKREVHGAGSD